MNPWNTYFKHKELNHLIAIVALISPSLFAGDNSLSPHPTGHTLAFARYISSLQERNPFTESGPVLVEIEASLPALYKEAHVLTLRRTGSGEKVEYAVVGMSGDAIVMQEIVGGYLHIAEAIEDLPYASTAVTPANYKFRYLGDVGKTGAAAHRYRITPRKKREGLIEGELWIDATTGSEVLQIGRLVKTSRKSRDQIRIVRDTTILNGCPLLRVTHVTMDTGRVGRGELSITELPANSIQMETPGMKVPARIVPDWRPEANDKLD